jgi:DinB family protein
MSTLAIVFGRPQPGEYDPYYERYIALVPPGDIVAVLERQVPETSSLLISRGAQRADFRYAPDKWSVKEVVGHLCDTERILSYRALRIARGDQTPIEGFEQDDYVPNGKFGQRSLADLLAEFADIRKATLDLFRHLDAQAAARRGVANKKEITARALAYIIAGHELHHRRILEEKYLNA